MLAALAALPGLFAAAPAGAANVSITSSPSNGAHYVRGEAITVRVSNFGSLQGVGPGGFPNNRMSLNVGGTTRQATVTSTFSLNLTVVDFSYTVTRNDIDTDGVAIPANSISGPVWNSGGSRNHTALTDQSDHKVIGSAAAVSSSNPSWLAAANLNGATLGLSLTGTTWGSSVAASNFSVTATPALAGLSVSGVSGATSGGTTATLTLSYTGGALAGDRTFAVTVAAAAHAGTLALTTGAVTVSDLPAATLNLSQASIPEKGGSATVTAVLDKAFDADTTITVTATPGANAVAGDFTQSGSVLTIAEGDTTGTGTVTIAAVNDAADQPDKSVTVSGVVSGVAAPSPVTLTIVDDDATPTAALSLNPASIPEKGGVSRVTATLSHPSGADTTITVSASAGSNAAAGDFALSPNAVLTIAAGETTSAGAVTVTANDDGADGPDKSVTVSGTASNDHAATDPPDVTLTIADDDGDIEVSGTRVRVSGEAGETVYRIGGRTVTVAVMPGAPAGVEIDFAGLPEATSEEAFTLTFSPAGSPAAGGAFALGPPEARTAVDVTVTAGRVPSAGLRLCLPATAAVREAARGRPLLLLRHDGRAWSAVAGSAASADGALVCAGGVASFSPFAVGYADTAPSFAADAAIAALSFTAGEAIDPVTLPLATGGDGTWHELRPPVLPAGLRFDGASRVLSGTPTEAFAPRRYTWTARDIDGESDALSFTMEARPALAAARERLRAVNESVLPELSRAMWGSVVDALTGRLAVAGLPVGDGVGAPASGLAEAAAFLRSNEGALKDGSASWRELPARGSFALGVGSGSDGPGGGSPATIWGSGDWRNLSLDDGSVDWSGELFSAHLGVDARLGRGVRGGVAASWFESEIDYADRSGDAAVAGVHRSRLPAVHPYAGWFGSDGSRLWGALGYGEGEVEIVDAALAARFGVQKSDSVFLAAAAGGSVPVASSGGFALSLKGSGEATRYSVADNGAAIAAASVNTQRFRLSATGGRVWALSGGGTLAPSLEAGARWDGGDGETGAGAELGGGVEWALPSHGLTVTARGRALVAHAGAAEEWGVSGSARLSPAGGRGLSLALSPRWGASESGLSRLWNKGVAGRASPVDGGGAARLEAGLGYGFREGAGLLTPSASFGYGDGARLWRLGTRFELGPDLALSVATERRDSAHDAEHALRVDLRMRW